MLEKEAQQRMEDREFQMKFFQMLMGHMHGHLYYSTAGSGIEPYTAKSGNMMNTSALPYGTGMPYNLENEN